METQWSLYQILRKSTSEGRSFIRIPCQYENPPDGYSYFQFREENLILVHTSQWEMRNNLPHFTSAAKSSSLALTWTALSGTGWTLISAAKSSSLALTWTALSGTGWTLISAAKSSSLALTWTALSGTGWTLISAAKSSSLALTLDLAAEISVQPVPLKAVHVRAKLWTALSGTPGVAQAGHLPQQPSPAA